jgi:hypothetical protein
VSCDRLWCSCCGRRYSRSTSAEILHDVRASYHALPIETAVGGNWSVPRRVLAELKAAGYRWLGDLDAASDDDLLAVPGVGPVTLARLDELLQWEWEAALRTYGVSTEPLTDEVAR